ncbi:MAG TPA: flavodoxin domain-containing protein [Syntrophorhabdaceae bacterium]|nr:flavodoxin domain-containing protein [Syntrophorhabdaceae bacterium]
MKENRVHYRYFLALFVAAVFILPAVAGNNYASRPDTGGSAELTHQKDDQKRKKVLIVYASRAGSTAEVAKAIGQTLKETGLSVDTFSITDMHDPDKYEAIIIGSAIRMGKWLPEAVDFVKKNGEILSKVPTAYFVVCNTMKEDTPENRKKTLAYLNPVLNIAPNVQPVDIGLFGGVIDFNKLSFVDRSVLKIRGVAEGDFRDWTSVRKWAFDVASIFTGK